MFTDLLNLPLDSDRASQSDQILSLSNMSWSDYEQLTGEEYLGYRASYFKGVITIVSPSLNHETISEVISGLVKTYCRKYNLPYFPMGSTTLKNPPKSGKEPDTSYSFDTRKTVPDLAIEVIYSSGETPRRRKTQGNAHQESGNIRDSLIKYQYLKVKEVWFWQNNTIIFYRLEDSTYVEIQESICLPQLSSNFLIPFVNRGLTETPLTIESDFYEQL